MDKILREDNRPIFERITDENTIETFARGREIRENSLTRIVREGRSQGEITSQEAIDAIFSTEAGSPFNVNSYQMDRTQIFIRHFLMGQSYDDIAQVFETDGETVRGIYGNAAKRLVYALELLDRRLPVVDNAKTYLEKNDRINGKLPKNQKHFLLVKLFGLTPKEVQNMDGTSQAVVSNNVKYVADRLKAGEMTFLDPSQEEKKAAQQRLEKQRSISRKSKAKRDQKKLQVA